MDFEAARAELIEHLSTEIKDERVLAAMRSIPRECFVSPKSQHSAYEDRPLPIGYDQTISQPFIIALMTEALELTGKEKVLEIGTGSGYQAAILAKLARRVITTERVKPLAEMAKKLLDKMGYTNVEVHLAEETLGWQREAPYNAIMVTAAAPRVPTDLMAQLSIGGRLVIPVGSRYIQELCKITRGRKKNTIENLGGCRFVSLIGRGAWEEEEKGA
jgi:protein-L-isoaspartate(D-aspartate) O-methyltransferase